MTKLKNYFKQLFCKHSWTVVRWHYTHGPCGNDPRIIEVEMKCKKCGKVSYYDVPRSMMKNFERIFKDKKVY